MRRYGTSLLISSLAALALCPLSAWAGPPTATTLLSSGATGAKKNFVIIGDGFQAGADQTVYNTWVDDIVLKGMFAEGPLWESMNAFNIIRVNVESVDSGVTQIRDHRNVALVPDNPSDGTRLNFTFTGANALADLPVLNGLTITDPAGRTIWDSAGTLFDSAGVVTGSVDYATGVLSLNYSAGNAPPAGSFTIIYVSMETVRNTALDFRYSGSWDRCWMEWGPNTGTNMSAILDALVPVRDYVFVVLNEPGFGGCGGGGGLTVTMAGDWVVAAHESGHMVGGLCDEYGGAGAYTGGEPGCVNITINTDRSTLKWREFVDPNTPIPTVFDSATMHGSETAGLFEGGYYKTTGVYRPHYNARMNGNRPSFGPVGYKRMKEVLDDTHDHDFSRTLAGDFNGDRLADIVVHNANALELYLSDGTHMVPSWVQTLPLTGWDSFSVGDRFLVGDFNGDGNDDLVVYNMTDFTAPTLAMLIAATPPAVGFTSVVRYDGALPGWTMKPGDEFKVGDFDGDGKADLYVWNTTMTDWPVGYLGMLRSTGSALEMSRRYDEMLPGWDKMLARDRFFVANANGSGGQDLFVVNVGDWAIGYLMPLLSTGSALDYGIRYDGAVPGWNNLMQGDVFYVADFDNDTRDDLYAFNGSDHPVAYLGVMRSTAAGGIDMPILHEGGMEGWDTLRAEDRFLPANVDGQGGKDLFIYNSVDRRLGRLVANPDGMVGSYQSGMVGKWNLGSPDVDVFLVANYDGPSSGVNPIDDLIVHNDASGNEMLGLMRNDGLSLDTPVVYLKWIHDYLYHSSGYW